MPLSPIATRTHNQTRTVPLARIGNSRGVRLPKEVIARYGLTDEVVLELVPEGVLVRAVADPRATWDETFAEMAAEREDWSDLGAVDGDGLERLPW